jgi:hypothetical protein
MSKPAIHPKTRWSSKTPAAFARRQAKIPVATTGGAETEATSRLAPLPERDRKVDQHNMLSVLRQYRRADIRRLTSEIPGGGQPGFHHALMSAPSFSAPSHPPSIAQVQDALCRTDVGRLYAQKNIWRNAGIKRSCAGLLLCACRKNA